MRGLKSSRPRLLVYHFCTLTSIRHQLRSLLQALAPRFQLWVAPASRLAKPRSMGVVLTWSGSSVHSGSSLAISITLSPGYGGQGMAAAEVYIRQREREGCVVAKGTRDSVARRTESRFSRWIFLTLWGRHVNRCDLDGGQSKVKDRMSRDVFS
jgi:hypothetical protein